MKAAYLLVLLGVLLAACATEETGFSPDPDIVSERVVCRERSDFCTQQYDPVTGSDGAEYSNGCVACSNTNVQWFSKLNS